jgi:hypothetical protein
MVRLLSKYKEEQSTYSNLTGALIDISIDDLAILINDNGPAAIAFALVPGMILREERLSVRKKELSIDSVSINLSTKD